jgi:hypothetical protein
MMTRARWSYGCTVFELGTNSYLMNTPFVKGEVIADTVRRWCEHHAALKRHALPMHRMQGTTAAVQKRLYKLPICHLRRMVWNCCHPDPFRRVQRLEDEMNASAEDWIAKTQFKCPAANMNLTYGTFF